MVLEHILQEQMSGLYYTSWSGWHCMGVFLLFWKICCWCKKNIRLYGCFVVFIFQLLALARGVMPKYVVWATGVVVLQNNFEVPNALAKWVEHQGIWKIIDFRQFCSIVDSTTRRAEEGVVAKSWSRNLQPDVLNMNVYKLLPKLQYFWSKNCIQIPSVHSCFSKVIR